MRVRATVTTNPGGMAELSQQIAKLMATLTQTVEGSSLPSAVGSPWECGHRWRHSGRSTPSHQTPTMAGVALANDLSPQPTHGVGGRRHRDPRL